MSNDFKSVPESVPGPKESTRLTRYIILTLCNFFENRVLGDQNHFWAKMLKMLKIRVFRLEKNQFFGFDNDRRVICFFSQAQTLFLQRSVGQIFD